MKSFTRSMPASIVGYAVLILILTAGAAQSLSGSSTVFSDDIVDGDVRSADLKDGGVKSIDVKDNTLTNSDFAPGAAGPDAYAAIVVSGGISNFVVDSRAKVIIDAMVTNPATGVFCIGNPGFPVRSATVTASNANDNNDTIASAFVVQDVTTAPCAVGDTVRVRLFDVSAVALQNKDFTIWLSR